jgi:hypothetical protein
VNAGIGAGWLEEEQKEGEPANLGINTAGCEAVTQKYQGKSRLS